MQKLSGRIIIPVIYAGIVIFVLTPLWAELAEDSIIENRRDLLEFYRFIFSGYSSTFNLNFVSHLSIWIWILIMIFSQALFLNPAIRNQGHKNKSPISVRLPIYSAALLFAIMTHAMLNATITAIDGPELKTIQYLGDSIEALTGNPDIFEHIISMLFFPVGNHILVMIYALILWTLLAIPWACLFYYRFRDKTDQVKKLYSWLLCSSAILLIVVIPCHYFASDFDKLYWRDTVQTSFGIVTALAILLLSLIPRLYLLWRKYIVRETD